MEAKVEEMLKLGALEDIRGNLDALKKKVDKILNLSADVNRNKADIAELKEIADDHDNKLDRLANNESHLFGRINAAEQYSRKKNVVIAGIPQVEDVDLETLVDTIIQKLGIHVEVEVTQCLNHRKARSVVVKRYVLAQKIGICQISSK